MNLDDQRYYPFLDGFRALAVLWIIWHHLVFVFPLEGFIHNQTLLLVSVRLGILGFLGVDAFFVISGFLISDILINDLHSRVRIKRFYVRRVFKIIPHYLFILISGFLIVFLFRPHYEHSLKSILSYFFFFQNYVEPIVVFGHLWVIAVEVHFYLVFPILMVLCCKLTEDFAKRRRILLFFLSILLVAGNVIRYHAFKDLTLINDPTVWQVTHVRFDALLFGCILRILQPKLLSLSQETKNRLRAFSFALGSIIFVSFFMYFNKIGWFYYTLAYLGSGSLIISGLLGFVPLVSLSSLNFLRYLGQNSYGIYLWHYILKYPFLEMKEFIETPILIILYISVSIFFGILSTKTLEKYFLNMRKKMMP